MTNLGNVNSIATAVFMAGHERYACSHTSFMFHGVGFDFEGKHRFEEKNLMERLQSVRQDQEAISSIIRENSDVSIEQVRQWFLANDQP